MKTLRQRAEILKYQAVELGTHKYLASPPFEAMQSKRGGLINAQGVARRFADHPWITTCWDSASTGCDYISS